MSEVGRIVRQRADVRRRVAQLASERRLARADAAAKADEREKARLLVEIKGAAMHTRRIYRQLARQGVDLTPAIDVAAEVVQEAVARGDGDAARMFARLTEAALKGI